MTKNPVTEEKQLIYLYLHFQSSLELQYKKGKKWKIDLKLNTQVVDN